MMHAKPITNKQFYVCFKKSEVKKRTKSDFHQSNLRKATMASANIALACNLNFQVGCQDRLRVNSNADEALT